MVEIGNKKWKKTMKMHVLYKQKYMLTDVKMLYSMVN